MGVGRGRCLKGDESNSKGRKRWTTDGWEQEMSSHIEQQIYKEPDTDGDIKERKNTKDKTEYTVSMQQNQRTTM